MTHFWLLGPVQRYAIIPYSVPLSSCISPGSPAAAFPTSPLSTLHSLSVRHGQTMQLCRRILWLQSWNTTVPRRDLCKISSSKLDLNGAALIISKVVFRDPRSTQERVWSVEQLKKPPPTRLHEDYTCSSPFRPLFCLFSFSTKPNKSTNYSLRLEKWKDVFPVHLKRQVCKKRYPFICFSCTRNICKFSQNIYSTLKFSQPK